MCEVYLKYAGYVRSVKLSFALLWTFDKALVWGGFNFQYMTRGGEVGW